jgi:hypothetical protein
MVIRPVIERTTQTRCGTPISAWNAISARQKQKVKSYWLIAQPDHANLSGDLAANFVSPQFPRLDANAVRAIGLHDSGWTIFHEEAALTPEPMLNGDGKPRAFTEFAPQQFTNAWRGSIERATKDSPLGGIIVSRHFVGLGEHRLQFVDEPETNRQIVRDFITQERERERQLKSACACGEEHLDAMVKALQFCDVLSLFLCCGADEDAVFPQDFGHGPVHIHCNSDCYTLSPSPFQEHGSSRPVSLGVSARLYPSEGEIRTTTLPFLLR